MLVPSIFGRNMFDDFDGFGGFPFGRFGRGADVMKTDIKDGGNNYELTIDMPGIRKEDVNAELNDGYLTISASSSSDNDQKDSEGRYIRRERHYGSFCRSFYVGDSVTKDEIKASFDNGVLRLSVPKKDARRLSDNRNYIRIE